MDQRDALLLERVLAGQVVYRPMAVAASQTVPQSATHLLVDTTTGSVTLTLPPVNVMQGRVLVVKKLVAANTVTLDGNGSETIDGAATLAWTTQYQVQRVLSDGTQWWTI